MIDPPEHTPKSTHTIISWIALLLSIAALTLGWVAYNRAEEDTGTPESIGLYHDEAG